MKKTLYFRVLLQLNDVRKGYVASGYRPTFRFDGTGTEHRTGSLLIREGNKVAPKESSPALLQPLNPDVWQDVGEGDVLLVCEGFKAVGAVEILEVYK